MGADQKSISSDEFVALIARHERRVRGFIACFTTAWSSASDDILQASYVTAWRKIESFSYAQASPDEEFVKWLCVIARNETRTYFRQRPVTAASITPEAFERLAACHERSTEIIESRHHALARCLKRLTRRQQELLQLRYWEGMSVDELAVRQGRRPTAVYNALSRTRKMLEQCISRLLVQEGY